ncbi:hypothetical protein [Mycobacterium malmoense]|uniref:PPW family C-terminal domain-containing PPE protein n=1 Tax=Mycobacterium malmoense TaxID=1780 RepID=UPI0009F39991|nr:hypothetical protein [Mycobacterium malmoense]
MVTLEGFSYLVGGLTAGARRAAAAGARPKKLPELDDAQAPAAAAPGEERAPDGPRRRVKVKQLGRGYEYMDVEPEPAAVPSGAGSSGFAGTAAGLITLPDDGFGGGPLTPRMPSTWGDDPASPDG